MLIKFIAATVLGLGLPLAVWSANTSATSVPCLCCGPACVCSDCDCDELGCACDVGGDCACDAECHAGCCL